MRGAVGCAASLVRRYRTYTSTTFEVPSYAQSHTRSMISVRVRTSPARRTKRSRSAYSRAVRLTGRPSTSTTRAAGSIVRAPRDRPQPRRELLEGERLDEVVVSPDVEPLHAIAHGIPGREHQDRRPDPGAADLGTQGEAVAIGQHDVEDERVVRVLGGEPAPVLDRRGEVHGVALLPQPALQEPSEPGVIFEQQNAHGRTPSAWCPSAGLEEVHGR
jgi:hypothetical protein